MVKQQLSKTNAPIEEPKKPPSSKGGCIGAIILLIGMIAYFSYSPSTYHYRQRGFDATAKADCKNAHTAAQAYFTDYPGSTISLSKLTSYGFIQSANVILVVQTGNRSNLKITSAHGNGTKTYTVNSDGSITENSD